jgi:hypothetical protein
MMSPRSALRGIQKWPRWTIIPIGLALAALAIALGLLLEPAGYALGPNVVAPTPTMPAIEYSRDLSDGCHDCHFSLPALQASAEDPSQAQAYWIEPESADTLHGGLGCLACHRGNGQARDKTTAHEGLVADMTVEDPGQCLICHRDLPSEIPSDRLRVPHGKIIQGILESEPCDVHCSDCHGSVGHGFDPTSGRTFCSMAVCLDCHQERELDVQIANCDACHVGPHDVAAVLTCNVCHTSTETWQQVALGVHPVPLPGKHGEVACFQCHRYPNFKGLNYACSDCHDPGHANWGDGDCGACHDPGATWEPVASP